MYPVLVLLGFQYGRIATQTCWYVTLCLYPSNSFFIACTVPAIYKLLVRVASSKQRVTLRVASLTIRPVMGAKGHGSRKTCEASRKYTSRVDLVFKGNTYLTYHSTVQAFTVKLKAFTSKETQNTKKFSFYVVYTFRAILYYQLTAYTNR